MKETMRTGAMRANENLDHLQNVIDNFCGSTTTADFIDTMNSLLLNFITSEEHHQWAEGGKKDFEQFQNLLYNYTWHVKEITNLIIEVYGANFKLKKDGIVKRIDEIEGLDSSSDECITLTIPVKPTQMNLSGMVNVLTKLAEKCKNEVPNKVDLESKKAIDDINDLYWLDQFVQAAKNSLIQVSTR